MSVSNRHFLQQGPALAAVARTGVLALASALGLRSAADPSVPGPSFAAEAAPLDPDLVHDYVAHVGGDPEAYAGLVPHHLFPQWTFPLAARTLEGADYPLLRVVNGGCRLRYKSPLPAGVTLYSQAQLLSVDDNGRRAVLQQHICSGPADHPDALVADLYAIVPLGRGDKDDGGRGDDAPKQDTRPVVPVDVRELALWSLPADAGFDFAKLTGDVNPIHWIPGYARMSGFRSVILHGFATMARTYEGLIRHVCGGDIAGLSELDVRFTRPLVLPARVGLYIRGREVFVGDAPGGPAYLVGSFDLAGTPSDSAAA